MVKRSSVLATVVVLALGLPSVVEAQTLVGFARLPASTFAPGPTSGQFITDVPPINGITPPFDDQQPIQGFSSVLRTSAGDFLVMEDNGFGQKPNSLDYVLRVYRISPDFRTRTGGTGQIDVLSSLSLRDPDLKVNFPIVAEAGTYPSLTIPGIPVDAEIADGRLLTGGDFDIESMRQAPDGTLWFGDEFGPFLLHTDSTGRVLEAPIPLPGVQSPQNPFLGGGTPNLAGSKGFEGMAISPDGRTLYPMLEGPVSGTPADRLMISEFDIRSRTYTGRRWFYRMDSNANAIGDLTAVSKTTFLVIERDGGQGAGALFKKIFLIDLEDADATGLVAKHEVADLLNLADPDELFSANPTFRFPFVTIESVIPLNEREIGVLNDNNYPFSSGRTPGQPDPDEFIIIRLDRPLSQYGRQ